MQPLSTAPALPCPSRQQLAELLDDSNDAEDLVEHLEQCPACQAVMEQLTALDPFDWVSQTADTDPTSGSSGRLGDHQLLMMRSLLWSVDSSNPAKQHQPGRLQFPPLHGYEVLSELGRGGMAVVYQARHLRLDRDVAVKMIRDRFVTPEQAVRFLTEAQVLAQLRHPHIVQVYEVGTHAEQPYFALELMEGGTLAQAIAGQPVPPKLAAESIETLALAIHHAHLRGILHRDLKPSNILLDKPVSHPGPVRHSLSGRCLKITDFGLAKSQGDDPGLTRTGHVVGTPHYLSPEQALGRPDRITVATDVYALGATLYEMLVGRPPFAAAAGEPNPTVSLLNRVISDLPVPPSRYVERLPRNLEIICLKCLEKDAEHRYASAAELAADLRRYLDGKPIVARPGNKVSQLWRLIRRHPVVASLITALVIALLGGTITSTHFAIKAAARARQALLEESIAASARDASRAAELSLERQSADSQLDRGLTLAGSGEVLNALPWIMSALKTSPDPHFQDIARLNLITWATHAPRLALWLKTHHKRFAVSPDNTMLATAGKTSADGSDEPMELQFWDLKTGNKLGPALITSDAGLSGMVFSPDGTRLLTGNGMLQRYQYRPGWATLWDVAGRREVGRVHASGAVIALVWLPDGRDFITGTLDGSAQLWRASDLQPQGPPIQLPQAILRAVISPDGHAVALSTDRELQVCNLDRLQPHGAPIVVRAGETLRSAAYAADGRELYTVVRNPDGRTFTLAVHPLTDAGTPTIEAASTQPFLEAFITVPNNGRLVARGNFSSAGQFIEISDGMQIWDAPADPLPGIDDVQLVYRQPATAIPLFPPRFDVGGNRIWRVTGTGKQVEALNPDTGAATGLRLPHDPGDTHFVLADSPDHRRLAIVLPTQTSHPIADTARVFDPVTGLPSGPPIKLINAIISMAYSPDSTMLAIGGHDHLVHLLDADGKHEISSPLPQNDMVNRIRFSNDGRSLAVATAGQEVRLWDVKSRTLKLPAIVHDESVSNVLFSPDGDRLVTLCSKAGYIWDTHNGRRIAVLPFDYPLPPDSPTIRLTAQFSPDGKILFTSNGDRAGRLWNAPDGKPLGPSLVTPQADASFHRCQFAFSPDSRILLAAYENGLVQPWDVITCRPLGAPTRQSDPICDVRFNPDGQTYRTVGPTGAVTEHALPHFIAADSTDLDRETRRSTGLTLQNSSGLFPLNRVDWLKVQPASGHSKSTD